MEISVMTNGVQKGISRELVDSLRAQLEEKERTYQQVLDEKNSLGVKLTQEQMEHNKSKEASASELARIKNVNEAIQRHHEEDIRQVQSGHVT